MKTIANFLFEVRIGLLALTIFIFAPVAHTADICVGPSAIGNGSGSDWNNMANWHTMSFPRGNTFWLADGVYTAREFPDGNESQTPIAQAILKKAIESSHGPSTGWVSALGDGQAVMQGTWRLSSSVVVDGQTGGGPGRWKTGFGIKLDASVGHSSGLLFWGWYQTVKHIEIVGNYGDGDQNHPTNDLVVIGGDQGQSLSYAYVHGAGGCLILADSAKNWLIEYCYFGFMEDTGGEHTEIMSAQSDSRGVGNGPITFRHCIFTSSGSTGGLMMKGPMEIYGCVFAPLDGNSFKGGNGLIGTWSHGSTQLKIYNNTFINVGLPILGILDGNDSGEFRNNIVYNSNLGGASYAWLTRSHNLFINVSNDPGGDTNLTTGTSDPFVNWPAGDFRLKAATTAGTTLSTAFNTDPLNLLRGADGVWDRGAHEFTAGQQAQASPQSQPPAAPTNLRVLNN